MTIPTDDSPDRGNIIETDNPNVTYDMDDLDGADICFVISQLCDFWDIDPLATLFAIEGHDEDGTPFPSECNVIREIIEGTQSRYDFALQIIIAYFARLERESDI